MVLVIYNLEDVTSEYTCRYLFVAANANADELVVEGSGSFKLVF